MNSVESWNAKFKLVPLFAFRMNSATSREQFAVEVKKEIKGIAEMSPRDSSKTRREEKRISDIRFSFLNRVNCCYFPGRGRKRLDAFNRITRSLVILNDFLGSIYFCFICSSLFSVERVENFRPLIKILSDFRLVKRRRPLETFKYSNFQR